MTTVATYNPQLLGQTISYGPIETKLCFGRLGFAKGYYHHYWGMDARFLLHTGHKRLKRKRAWNWLP